MTKRLLRRYRLLKSYLRQPGFGGVWLSRAEIEEIVALLAPHMEEKGKP